MNVLEINSLVKTYGSHTALSNIDLQVPKGCIFGLLGPNGAGKTTLIRIINQIIEADSGSIFFNGQSLRQEHIQHIGYLPEERGLYKKMKVDEQLLYFAQIKGLSKTDAQSKVNHWLNRLQVSEWKNKRIEDLSKGMAQKIQFIATVIHAPELLILDEPFSGFDPMNAEIIKDEILALRDAGTTVILSTHRMESVELLCDYIAMINKSHKVIDGSVAEIRKNAKTNLFSVKLIKNDEIPFPQWESYQDHQEYVSFSIPLNGASPNMMLKELMQYGEVIGFEEVIPSIGDIFIQKAKENDHA
ncbi:MAG TPA: ATP-binding cassette domain-containing protein [Cyclobacteriaceae bacterium]|nr:ATP-binding cassette domain-containing protein [Cyclobacteriaceae bacterium]